SVESYRAVPDAVKTFLKQVPTAWDETRALSGEPGDTLVIARRNGGVWYIAGINGRDVPRDLSVHLGFLKDGEWRGMLIQDGGQDRQFEGRETNQPVKPDRIIGFRLRPHSGFVIRLERVP